MRLKDYVSDYLDLWIIGASVLILVVFEFLEIPLNLETIPWWMW